MRGPIGGLPVALAWLLCAAPARAVDWVVPDQPHGGLQLGLAVDGAELFEQGPTAGDGMHQRFHLSGRVTADRVRVTVTTSPLTAFVDEFGEPVYSELKAIAWWGEQPPLRQAAAPFEGGTKVTGRHNAGPASLELDLPVDGDGPGALHAELRRICGNGGDWSVKLHLTLHRDAPARVHLLEGEADRLGAGRLIWEEFGTRGVLYNDTTGPDLTRQDILAGDTAHLFDGDLLRVEPDSRAVIDHPAGYRLLVGPDARLIVEGRVLAVESGPVLVENLGGPGEFDVRTPYSHALITARRFLVHHRLPGGRDGFSLSLEDGGARVDSGPPPREPVELRGGWVMTAERDPTARTAIEAMSAADRAAYVAIPPLPAPRPRPGPAGLTPLDLPYGPPTAAIPGG